jgi:hypothetical protein
MTYKSSDGGASFVPDTIGAAANNLATTVFLVDKNGIQHAAAYVNNSGSGNAKAVWRKDPGQPWSMDTNGLATLTHVDQPECFGYDEAGTIYYASYNGSQQSTTIFKRAANATTWTMSGVIALYVYEIHGQAGKVIAATDAGLWRFGGTQWVPVNMPQGMPVNQRKYGVNTARFADNGTVWAYIEELSPAAGAIGRGIWYTSDLVNWQYPEPNVDTSWFGALVTMGDSVFVLPRFYDGVYVFSNPPLSVPGTKGKGVLEFVAAPNPVTQKTTLQFSLGKPANAFLRIVDGEGRTIYTSGESHFESGKQFLDLDLRHLSPGMYVCELIVDGQKYQRAILKL